MKDLGDDPSSLVTAYSIRYGKYVCLGLNAKHGNLTILIRCVFCL